MQLKEWVKINRRFFIESDLRFMLRRFFSSGSLLSYGKDIFLDEEKIICLDEIKRMYTKGLPMAYILGEEEFFGLKIKVTPQVLIPRKETELIVEKAIDIIKKNDYRFILDLCCGSANISIAIKKTIGKNINVFSSDISMEALGVAQANCRLHNITASLANVNLLEGFKHNCFDLIISNPPYVAEDEICGCLQYEPRISLNGGAHGLMFIRAILNQAYLYLKNGGSLIMEIGYRHKEPIAQLLEKTDRYEIIEWLKDYDGNWRGVLLKTLNSKP